jgi:hypothetical protein
MRDIKLDEIIKSENTDEQFTRWSDYRSKLTALIKSEIESDTNKKPTLAIWGAGGCNDIDLARLSSVCKLVLIDCEKSRAQAAIKRYNLTTSQAVAVDLFFYDIPYERCEQWEELLYDSTDLNELHSFLSELLLEAVSSDMLILPEFDYSVVVGLTSQLNSRLAALLYIYRQNYSQEERQDILNHLAIMDQTAVRRLHEMLRQTTHKKIIWGYEDSIAETGEKLSLTGNQRFQELFSTEQTDYKRLTWPFMDGKSYNMKIITKSFW